MIRWRKQPASYTGMSDLFSNTGRIAGHILPGAIIVSETGNEFDEEVERLPLFTPTCWADVQLPTA